LNEGTVGFTVERLWTFCAQVTSTNYGAIKGAKFDGVYLGRKKDGELVYAGKVRTASTTSRFNTSRILLQAKNKRSAIRQAH